MGNQKNMKANKKVQTIQFEFELKIYETDMSAYDKDYILLPDGRTLGCDGWLEVYPPYPKGLKVVPSVESYAVARYIDDVVIEEM